jgi:hypothetical protein
MNLQAALQLWLASPTQVYDPMHTWTVEGSPRYIDGPPHFKVPEGREIEKIDIIHEEGWSNDNGTSWPAEVTVVITTVKVETSGRRRGRKKHEVSAGSDPIEFLKELFDLVEQNAE